MYFAEVISVYLIPFDAVFKFILKLLINSI